jgi:hypothetical protein
VGKIVCFFMQMVLWLIQTVEPFEPEQRWDRSCCQRRLDCRIAAGHRSGIPGGLPFEFSISSFTYL